MASSQLLSDLGNRQGIPSADCEPTLTDQQVLNFCQTGLLMLEGIIPEETNARVREYCDQHNGGAPVGERWYEREVTLNPTLTGAVRSLLGKNFNYFQFAANHRDTALDKLQSWHRDGGAVFSPRLDCLQVFYVPQDTTIEMGPTEVLPGSHLLFSMQQYMSHYGHIRGAIDTAAPAGSVYITHYGIWHRRMLPTVRKTRDLLKFWYVRNAAPQRDWIQDTGFLPEDAFHAPAPATFGRETHRAKNEVAELFYWLCGRQEEYDEIVKNSNLPIYFGLRASRQMN